MRDSEISKENVTELFDRISSVYDFVNRVISFGIDKYWRNSLLRHIPILVDQTLVDLATGTGDQILALSKSPFIGKFYGFDLSTNMLLLGQKKLAKKGLKKKTLLQIGNALGVPVASEFCDLTTISFGIRNVTEPLKCLSEMHRILKTNGLCFVLEFSIPKSKIIKTLYLFYLRNILPKIGYWISKNKEAYSYLNETIESFPSGEAFLQMMKSAGFSSCKQIPLSFGIVTLYLGKKT
jgi:demethylmenaquinone methyltransferase/2-methoxy-6-polyprenyl-1,4-benzoquinol methylase